MEECKQILSEECFYNHLLLSALDPSKAVPSLNTADPFALPVAQTTTQVESIPIDIGFDTISNGLTVVFPLKSDNVVRVHTLKITRDQIEGDFPSSGEEKWTRVLKITGSLPVLCALTIKTLQPCTFMLIH